MSEATDRWSDPLPLTTQPIEAVAMADGTLNPDSAQVKRCPRCGQAKALNAFAVHRGKPRVYCLPCAAAKGRAWREKNAEHLSEYRRRLYAENKETVKARARQSYHKDLSLSRLRQQANKYGLTVDELRALYAKHGHACALCKRSAEQSRNKKLFVDHDHATGRVRGLLCMACNSALGVLGDTAESLERVLSYLRGKVIRV